MAPVPLEPFITGVPEATLGIPKTPDEINESFPTLNVSHPTVMGTQTIADIPEKKYRGMVVNQVVANGSIQWAGSPCWGWLNLTLKHNGVVIGTTREWFEFQEFEDDPETAVNMVFPFYEGLILRRNDTLSITADITSHEEFSLLTLNGSVIKGLGFF